jgi:hypothetical protein
MDYKIVVSDFTHDELEEKVRQAIANGWKPQGGVAVLCIPPTPSDPYRKTFFYQAVIK